MTTVELAAAPSLEARRADHVPSRIEQAEAAAGSRMIFTSLWAVTNRTRVASWSACRRDRPDAVGSVRRRLDPSGSSVLLQPRRQPAGGTLIHAARNLDAFAPSGQTARTRCSERADSHRCDRATHATVIRSDRRRLLPARPKRPSSGRRAQRGAVRMPTSSSNGDEHGGTIGAAAPVSRRRARASVPARVPPALQLLVLSVMTTRRGVRALRENLEERL
jgi:hypothetical protein